MTSEGSEGGDDGYVHRPGQARDDETESSPSASGDEASVTADPDDAVDTSAADDDDGPTVPNAGESDGLGLVGWALVSVVAVAFLVIPGAIYVFPAAPGRAGVPFLVAMLALPFLPALLLGGVAVWTAVRDRKE